MAVAPPHPGGRVARASTPVAEPRAHRLLLVAMAACLLYAGFADGATGLPQESWLQLGLAVIATSALAGWLYGNGLSLSASRTGWVGLALLLGFAVWTAISIAWSVTPDRSWVQLNRALAAVLAVLIGLLLGSSLDRAAERTGLAIALAAVPVALYALGGKTLPGVHLGGLIDLDQAGTPSRLQAPLGYGNALALVCVCGLLPMLRIAADPWRGSRGRIAALLGVALLGLVAGLTESRGGAFALVVGLVVLVALTTERLRTVVLALSAAVAVAFPLLVALQSRDLTTDGLPLAQRSNDALQVLVALAISAVLLAAWGSALLALEGRGRLSGERGRQVGRPAAAVAGVILAGVVLGLLVTGVASDAVSDFKQTRQPARVTDPNALGASTEDNRWPWWQEAAGAWSAKPVAGWGAGSFPVPHLLYRKTLLTVGQPHSMPLQWLAETGVVGLLLVGGGLLALLAAALSRVRAEPWAIEGAPPGRGASAALVAIAAAWLVHALYDRDWDIPAVTLPMLFALGVLAARPRAEPSEPLPARGLALVGVGVGFVLVCLSAILPALAQTRVNTAVQTAARATPTPKQLADAAAAADLARRLNPLSVEPLFAAANVAEQRGRPDEARADLLEAIDRQPDAVAAWAQLARLDFERQDRDAAQRESLRALALDPLNPATITLARRIQQGSVAPYESVTATGTPLPTQVSVAPPPAPAPPRRAPRLPKLPGLPGNSKLPKPAPAPAPAPLTPPAPPAPAPVQPVTPAPTPVPAPTPTPTVGPDGRLAPPRTSGDRAPTPEP